MLSFKENCVDNWRAFELDFDIYVVAAHPGANAKTMAYMLLNLAGREAIERSLTFEHAEGESMEDPGVFKRNFRELYEHKKNLTMLRHCFNTRNQKPTESFVSCFVVLTKNMTHVNLGTRRMNSTEIELCTGKHSNTVRKLLLREPDFTLEKAKELCVLHELADIDISRH